jgi:2Fe-2S ferredoxin
MSNINIEYVNSLGSRYLIQVAIKGSSASDNLMEIIRDYGYEDWGECRGKTWCRSCHVGVDKTLDDVILAEEGEALNLIENRITESRLACQISLNSSCEGATFCFIGDD